MGGLEDNDPEAEETSESASISSPRAWKDRVVLLSASAARMYSSRSSSPWMRPDDRRQEGVTHTWSRVALPIKIMCPLRVVVKNEPWFECVLY